MLSPSTKSKIGTAKTIMSTVGSIAAAVMVVRSVSHDYLPPEFQEFMYLSFRNFINKFSTQLTMIIYEFEGIRDNEIYTATQLYLADRISPDIHRLKVTKNANEQHINVAMEINEEYIDIYNGVKFSWSLVSKKNPTRECQTYDEEENVSTRTDLRSLELTFHSKHKDLALNDYLPYIINYAKVKKQNLKTLKLFTVDRRMLSYSRYKVWTSVNLDHPASFETVAMDTGVKEMVMKDLDRFLERREYYRKVGKAWKRGYLLYGPPGTGKSSLIAAMANYLNFDVYDLELTDVKSNSDLRRLLVETANRSILVVEDIDCSVELHDRVQAEGAKGVATNNQQRGKGEDRVKVTLSGFLNFVDGLWSSCGDERIIIFTTNRKDKLDPALIRPGRMDVQIHFPPKLMSEVEVTPAEVAEQLLKDNDPDIALGGLLDFLYVKMKEIKEAKARLKKEEELSAKENDKKQQEIKLDI
ncbi:putative AAA+ ATPase domain, ATPase, AAA-type, core, AAA-type ATPase domain-containing protein [Helianthus annuus]|nr:putative AAA+ ATPase domain, ATPase, AAA-type, core, AAA-type ATPase domain-containing protein [Helianthus annuus]